MVLTGDEDPLELFRAWLDEAEGSEVDDATAAALATATREGRPSVRMVLLKGLDERGFVFYTNLGSRKAADIQENPWAALCFHWKSLARQVRVEGPVSQVDDAEADAYFASRPRVSRIGAWASKQSEPLEGRWELERRVAAVTARHPLGDIPRPEFWSGFRIDHQRLEFWVNQPFRLHDRFEFTRTETGWQSQRLYP